MRVDCWQMEEAERIFEEAKSHESNCNNLIASDLYTEFINQALACPDRQSLWVNTVYIGVNLIITRISSWTCLSFLVTEKGIWYGRENVWFSFR